MGHYPIKCIRCAHIMTNETVQFNVAEAGRVLEDMLNGNREASNVNNNTATKKETKKASAKSSMWADDDDDAPEQTSEKENNTPTNISKLMTFSQIKEYCKSNRFRECEPRWQKIDITPDFADKARNEDLLVGITFQKNSNGDTVYANRRFCSRCGCELPLLSGAMPTYNVTVLGTSSSGKTVYLCALNWLLSQGQGNLPGGSTLTCVSANKANNDLVNRSNALFTTGVLPGTTQILLTEPLTVQMTYRIGNKQKKCLLAMADMRGEDLITQDPSVLTMKGGYFSKADAFMFLVSPMNMPYIRNILPDDDGDSTDINVHQTLMSNVSQYILPFFENGQIKAPCAVMMSKCDILSKHANTLRIPPHNPVIAAETGYRYTKTYFLSHDAGTRSIVQCDVPLYNFLRNTFSRSYFTSFSSLGENVVVAEDDTKGKHIQNAHFLHPIRVVDPVMYLLMSLDFLPPYYLMEPGSAHEKENRRMMENWMGTHL